MNKSIKTALVAGALLAGGTYAASAQMVYGRPGPLPGETGTPADIVTVPLGVAGTVAGDAVGTAAGLATVPFAPLEGRSAYDGGPMYYNGIRQRPTEPAAAPNGVSETGNPDGVAENPRLGQ